MNYKLKIVDNKQEWNDFVIKNFKFYSFLDSWERGECQDDPGMKVFRYGIFQEEEKIGQIMLIKHTARRGTFFLAPHGPLITKNYFKILKNIIPQIKYLAKQEKVVFLRICPQIQNTQDHIKKYEQLGFRFAPIHVHAEETHLLDITKSEDELLTNMRKTTRYLIKRARKEGVEVYQDNSKESINNFIQLHKAHANRTNGKSKYNAFNSAFIKTLFEQFSQKDITLLNARYKGQIEASLVTIRFGKQCVYYLGASDIRHSKFSPAYLLQFEAILNAKKKGCTTYNFRGVSPDGNPKHPLQGVSLFKRGFGGEDYYLLHAQDYIFNWKYWINYIIEVIRRKKRGYYYIKPKKN